MSEGLLRTLMGLGRRRGDPAKLASRIFEKVLPGEGGFFDPVYCRQQMELAGIDVPEETVGIVRAWLDFGVERRIVPTPFFDEEFYLKSYEDIAKSGLWGFEHFVTTGRDENRAPSALLQPVADWCNLFADDADVLTLGEFLKFATAHSAALMSDSRRYKFAVSVCQPEYYAAFSGIGRNLNQDETFWHYVLSKKPKSPPTPLFNEAYYKSNWEKHCEDAILSDATDDAVLPDVGHAFLHWLEFGRTHQVLPTPIFDEEFYRSRYKDLQNWRGWIFEHYIVNGINEKRQPAEIIDPLWYLNSGSTSGVRSALIDFQIAGDGAGRLPSRSVCLDGVEPARGMPGRLDGLAILLRSKLDRLDGPTLKPLIDHAASIEPLVMRPYGQRKLQYPPIKHDHVGSFKAGELVRRAVGNKSFDNVVLIPHCRMAGSARVAGLFVQSLRAVWPNENLLIVLTDLPDFQKPEWFGEEQSVVNIPELLSGVSDVDYGIVLRDLLRGVQPRRVFNINSRVAWDTFAEFGNPLSSEMQLYAYLFTWDLDKHGNKGGYPVQYFQKSFDFLSGVLIDNKALSAELRSRYLMSEPDRARLRVVHTPAVNPHQKDYTEQFERRRREGRSLRFLWAGRFDRQKRFDIVLEIAERRPEVEFLVWGKRVLNDFELNLDNLPANVRMMGTFEDIDDIPLESADAFLYTSQWDGLPTILIDIAVRGLPIVGARVGGTADIMMNQTSFPVDDVLSTDAYVAAIGELNRSPVEVTRRCKNMRRFVQRLCSEERYNKRVVSLVEGSEK